MVCSECQVWPLASDDNFCSWCGASQLRYSVRVGGGSLSRSDYPPPVPVVVSNESTAQELVVLRIAANEPWVTAFTPADFPARIRAGEERSFLVDVDTFAAAASGQADLRVEVAHAQAEVVVLTVWPDGSGHGAAGV